MKILKVACEQFAGIRDFEAEFKDGINIVFGANESGKSSLVNILTETLLKRPGIDRRRDGDFIAAFFPCPVKNGAQGGNFIDGSVTFETERGVFTLSKKWRNDGRGCAVNLVQPSGDITDNYDDIAKLLSSELKNGEGIFREILLSPQTVNLESIKNLISHSGEFTSGGEIIKRLTEIYAEAGSDVSIVELENKINGKISDLSSNWDKAMNAPKYKNRKCGISEAFKTLNEINRRCAAGKDFENRLMLCEKKFKATDDAASEARDRLDEFQKFEVQLGQYELWDIKIKGINKELQVHNAAMRAWPQLDGEFKKAEGLALELNQVEFMALMKKNMDLQRRFNALSRELEGMPTSEQIERDIRTAERANDIIKICMDKLRGLNLKLEARINGDYKMNVISTSVNNALINPSRVDNNIFEYNIDKAVIINIPDVAEMHIGKAGVNMAEAKAEWDKNKEIIYEIVARYKLELGQKPEERSIDVIREKLRAVAREYEIKLREKNDVERERANLKKIMNDSMNEGLKHSYSPAVEDNTELLRDRETIINDIKALCQRPENLAEFIFTRRGKIDDYKGKYESPDKLGKLINQENKELEEALKNLNAVKSQIDDLPDWYKTGSTQTVRAELEDNLRAGRNEREAALKSLNNARYELENFQREYGGSEKLEAERQNAERDFNDKKTELAHWENILKIFNRTKEELNKNPVDYLITKFSHYLDIISGGRLVSDNGNADTALMPEIYSRDRRLSWLNISEGTKETVALAFRLAVIDQIYQDGGAVAVLDDPLVNMDAERAEKACGIIKEFAEKNQVIFLTCRREYQDILEGNFIELKS